MLLKCFDSPEAIKGIDHSYAKALGQDAACIGGAMGRLGGCLRENGLCRFRFQPSLLTTLQS